MAETSGVCNITDCLSGLTINSSVEGDGTHGGFVGVQGKSANSNITMKGCAFSGKLLGAYTTSCGGFVGWRSKNLTINDSIFAPQSVTIGDQNSAMFACNGATAYNSYYLYALGEDTDNQGKPGYSVTAGENVTLALAGEASKYEVSGITVYKNNSGLLYNGTCYAGEDDEVSLTLNHPETPNGRTFSGYTASAGTLNEGVLTMPAEDVTISGEFEFADGVGTRLVGRSISVEGDVGINFYMELGPEIAASETAYIQFTIPTGDKTETKMVPVSKAVKKDGNYVFKCDVAAKEMTSDIKAQVIDPGSDKSGYDYTYSVKEYADALLSHSDGNWEYTKVAPLVKAMLNYGTAAQNYFDRNPEKLANADLSDEDRTLADPEISIADPVVEDLPEDTTFEGATLSLKSQTSLSLYFTDQEELTFTCVDEKGTERTVETVRNGDTQIARIRNIPASELQYKFNVSVKKGETESGSVTYSPMNYCYKALNGGAQNEKLQNVVKALYWYSQEAYDYFYENIVDLGELRVNSYEAKKGDVLTGKLKGNKKITVAAGATVTLRDADITSLDNDDRNTAPVSEAAEQMGTSTNLPAETSPSQRTLSM